jgi:hypothetical protein
MVKSEPFIYRGSFGSEKILKSPLGVLFMLPLPADWRAQVAGQGSYSPALRRLSTVRLCRAGPSPAAAPRGAVLQQVEAVGGHWVQVRQGIREFLGSISSSFHCFSLVSAPHRSSGTCLCHGLKELVAVEVEGLDVRWMTGDERVVVQMNTYKK